MNTIEVRTAFDRDMLEHGPPAVFTVDAKGRIGLDEWRTREHYSRLELTPSRAPVHCVYRDRATGFAQYVLLTSPDLCASHPRQDITVYPDQGSALAAVASLGDPPISRDPIRGPGSTD
jgi:hypothetical protein